QSSRIVFRLWRTLGDSDMPRCFNKASELLVGYRVSGDPEALNARAVRRRLFGIMMVGSHRECVAGNPHHARVGSGHIDGVDVHVSGVLGLSYLHAGRPSE